MKAPPKPIRSHAKAVERWRVFQYALFGTLLLVVSAFLAWRNNPLRALPTNENRLALGAQIYAENCAACHGQNGEGHAGVAAAPALDASEHAWHHPDGQLQQLILEGGQLMPSFRQRLTNREIIDVIRHIQTWWAPGQLQSQQSVSAQFPLEE